MTESIPLSRIKLDERCQPRVSLEQLLINEYAADMRSGDAFPPLVVFRDGDDIWLADGFHRRYAAVDAGLAKLECEVFDGDLRDAILYSCQANASQKAARRTNADKQRAILTLLSDDEWRGWADSKIARHCVVDQETVSRVRRDHLPKSEDTKRTVERGGKVFTMDTAKIGRSRTADERAAALEERLQSDRWSTLRSLCIAISNVGEPPKALAGQCPIDQLESLSEACDGAARYLLQATGELQDRMKAAAA